MTRKEHGVGWRVWADTGGTFTDCIAVGPGGEVRRAKVLSTSRMRVRVGEVLDARRWRLEGMEGVPAFVGLEVRGADDALIGRITGVHGDVVTCDAELGGRGQVVSLCSKEEAPIFGARLAMGVGPDAPLDGVHLRIGTTKGTNALLERAIAPVAMFVTKGFGDLLRIGDQRRPDLFALAIEKPEPLHAMSIEVDERLSAAGEVVRPLTEETLRADARAAIEAGMRVGAVALMHAWLDARHERRVGEVLREVGFEHVVLSSDVAPSIGLLGRAQTAVVSGALTPVVGGYLQRVRASLGGGATLRVMTSAGGLAPASDFDPKDSLLSGPAGGVVGASDAARAAGLARLISFDMGGTSTDVARVDLDAGGAELESVQHVGDATIHAPAMAIETVAAGGGSVCAFEHDQLRVGPSSAGAWPGPACYGAGGPLTMTDVNLLLGRLDASRFGLPLDEGAAWAALEGLLDRIEERTGVRPDAEATLEGLGELANERMAGAIARVSAARGYDPREHALVAFGGAAGQHACAVAARLGIETVLIAPDASLLSARGIGSASLARIGERAVLRRLGEAGLDVAGLVASVREEATARLEGDGVERSRIEVRRAWVSMRPVGHESMIDVAPEEDLRGAFELAYRRLFGHGAPERDIEVVSIGVECGAIREDVSAGEVHVVGATGRPIGRRRCRFAGAWVEATVYDRRDVGRDGVAGPAIVVEAHTSTVVEPGWTVRADASGSLVLERREAEGSGMASGRPREVAHELIIGRVIDIGAQMGETIRRTSVSANVKERLDFSCAVLDGAGRVVASAPHVPVHLGALGLCVRRVREAIEMREGDVVLTNHPGFGGSHLPDLTTITPVHDSGRLVAYVATRAHHAEIGGIRPGSMPPNATRLSEEGVAIAPMRIVEGGTWREGALRAVLEGGAHPTRQVEDNLADIRASVAANERGRGALVDLCVQVGAEGLAEAMEAQIGRSARLVREAIGRLGAFDATAVEHLDDGTPLSAKVRVRGERLEIDLRGSGGAHPYGLNAPAAVTRSAVMYVVRLLVQAPIALNEGLLEPVDLIVESGILDPAFVDDPAGCPAVAGGNVETSQRLVDTLLKALGLCAGSQGTMNNLTFGNERFGFYETICGGAGATEGADGADAVHTHMTNTRITDAEIIERRYPVRLHRFAIRHGSGGRGRWVGGSGVVREYVFLEGLEASILSQHRRAGAYGLAGGMEGAVGTQVVVRASGERVVLGGIDGVVVGAGDCLVIETPGGGGWGVG